MRTHSATQAGAVKAINRMQTMRNWIIGYYIVEFEQKGKERAEYGEHLLEKLEERVVFKPVFGRDFAIRAETKRNVKT